jgi:hypothetical protein
VKDEEARERAQRAWDAIERELGRQREQQSRPLAEVRELSPGQAGSREVEQQAQQEVER